MEMGQKLLNNNKGKSEPPSTTGAWGMVLLAKRVTSLGLARCATTLTSEGKVDGAGLFQFVSWAESMTVNGATEIVRYSLTDLIISIETNALLGESMNCAAVLME